MEPIIAGPTEVNKEHGYRVVCEGCGAVIAVKKDFGHFEVKWKELFLVVHGTALVYCRICGRKNKL